MRSKAFSVSMLALILCVILPAPAKAQRGRGQAVQLPAGAGQELVQNRCTQCHGLNQIANSPGYTEDGWQALIGSMVVLPENEVGVVTQYLASSFPERPAPEAVIISGPVEVTIREWMAPSLGSRPHDPLAARDGSIWWTGQWVSVLGRVNPATSMIREFPLGDDVGPHGLAEDGDGNIWYTGINQNHVGKLDPNTGLVTKYSIPEAAVVPEGARGPHTPIFDQNGTLWFTLQSGMVGRLIPRTGEMRVVATPTSGTYPYGIQVNSRGVPWYVDFRGNRIGSIDPETMEIMEHTLPSPDARPRRIALTPDDMVWYTDYARGYLGRFDPVTGEVKEWPSPGGPRSLPYGIATVDNIIWYSESGVRDDTLVRFDSETEEFQTWLIPSGGGVIRNMMATADGNLVLACSGVNRVALVEISD